MNELLNQRFNAWKTTLENRVDKLAAMGVDTYHKMDKGLFIVVLDDDEYQFEIGQIATLEMQVLARKLYDYKVVA